MASTKLDGKQKYKGSFNWYGATMTLYCHARSKEHAFFLFTSRIAKKVERNRRGVYYYFSNPTRDGYLIEKVAR